MQQSYSEFIQAKQRSHKSDSVEYTSKSAILFDFQRDIVSWALRKGRACIWADCGLGKTFMQLEWAINIPGKVLILCPLAVAEQTITEAGKLGFGGIAYSRDGTSDQRVTVANYEMMHNFDPSEFMGIVLDESSIIKNFNGATRTAIMEFSASIQYRLACTATPAPNDCMELGNHSEFVGAMSRNEMLSKYFTHDGGETQKWRLKGHAEEKFWEWVASWAVMIRKPSDIGHSDEGFDLPALNIHSVVVDADHSNHDGHLFPMPAASLQERIKERRFTAQSRCEVVADLCKTGSPWIVWCNLNIEADTVTAMIPGAIQISGSESAEAKTKKLVAFSRGEIEVLVTKPSIAGMGMNWQHCHNVAFLGLSDSWEQYYQAMRRCWRFGQKNPVNVHVVTASTEGAVVANIERKERDAATMAEQLLKYMKPNEAIHATTRNTDAKETEQKQGKKWKMILGDCVESIATIPDNSIGFSVFSPPFASLYTYSASNWDMGNCSDDAEFKKHFGFLVPELLRVTQPGRLVSLHCMNLPTSKARDGVIGLRDFRGQMINEFASRGWIFHSEVCIWKDPVTAMQRTKALGLLWKQIKKDSSMSRQGIPDYVVTFRKPGENMNPIKHSAEEFPVDQWQRWASPVWDDINPSDTLQKESSREEKDERHICPLQLEVIRRCVRLWSNPGDLVLSPFAGIGSEGFVAVKEGREFVGLELKRSYYNQACLNLEHAESDATTGNLFNCNINEACEPA